MSNSVSVSIATNSVITISKLFGFLTTGSPTLFAETIHSATDVINQVLLKVGEVKAQRQSTQLHPFGFGKERYFWALVSSISVLFLGCGVSIRHGIEALSHHEPGTPFSNLAIGLLIFAGLLELYTFRVAWHELGGMSGLRAARTNTTVLAVLLEDSVALLGIAITLFVAFWSRLVEPAPLMDAIISIFIGLLLGSMALMLAKLNKDVLIDIADLKIDAEIERAIRERAGIELHVASSLMDSEHCLLFVHVTPSTLPANVDFARLNLIGDEIKDHIAKALGKTVDHVYWQFPLAQSATGRGEKA
ncbi:MAG: cation diffusion facilitator family transporter [Proteobacteria bacterium]|nr:cation diffusion facilitator family transporter [Pseudomonadota bacterium]